MEILDRFESLPKGKSGLYWIQLEIMNNHSRYDEKLATQIEILENDPEAYVGGRVLPHFYWIASEIASLGLSWDPDCQILHSYTSSITNSTEKLIS